MYTVLLDGKEVRTSGITVRLRPPESITLEIDLPYVTLNTLRGRAQVVIDPAVEDTLISLGWTPPAPDLPTERVPKDAHLPPKETMFGTPLAPSPFVAFDDDDADDSSRD